MKKIFRYFIVTILAVFINVSLLHAASASINVSSSTSKIVVGNTFSVTIKVSSGNTLGTWEFTPKYDSSKFKLTSGPSSVVDYGDGKTKSRSYTYKFKAIGTGSGQIGVKSYGVIDYNSESKMSVSTSSKTIKVITQAEQQASYSKNNNLKSLSIEGLTLSPSFSSGTTKYTATAGANTTTVNVKASVQDSKSKVSGTGKHNVYEGENKINVKVTAQNGSTKTYTIIVNVTDPNPIEVTIDNQKHSVVKRESSLDEPEGFDKKTVTINDQKIPGFYNELNNITLVGLKDTEGDVSLYIYDEQNKSYQKYENIKLSQTILLPLEMDKEVTGLTKEEITIDDVKVPSLKLNDQNQYIIKARNFTSGKQDYYIYDSDTNNIVKYVEDTKAKEENKSFKEQILGYKKMIVLLGIETVIIIFVLVCILFAKIRKNKKRRRLIQERIKEEKLKEEKKQQELIAQEEIKEEVKEEIKEEVKKEEPKKKQTTKKTNKSKKKEVQKDEKEEKQKKDSKDNI